jgi:hypothetical protein
MFLFIPGVLVPQVGDHCSRSFPCSVPQHWYESSLPRGATTPVDTRGRARSGVLRSRGRRGGGGRRPRWRMGHVEEQTFSEPFTDTVTQCSECHDRLHNRRVRVFTRRAQSGLSPKDPNVISPSGQGPIPYCAHVRSCQRTGLSTRLLTAPDLYAASTQFDSRPTYILSSSL